MFIHMLYEQIRYAGAVRRIYRLRHLLTQKNPPDLGSRLGYPKYSKQFYRVKGRLKREGILDRHGRFVESLPNLLLAEMPLHASREQIGVLGNRVPYCLLLGLMADSPKGAGDLIRELHFSRGAVYRSLERMERSGLVRMEDSRAVAEGGPASEWLARYLEVVRASIRASGDVAILFSTIPAYIGGPHAYYTTNYEPGRPAGPADMLVLTYAPFLDLVKSMVRDSRSFREYPTRVEVCATGGVEAEWVGGMPYDRNAKEVRW